MAVRVGDPDLWSTAGTTLAVVELSLGAPDRAFAAASLATRYAQGLFAAEAFAVQGVAALREGDTGERTLHAFATAADLARDLRATAPGSYRTYEVEGLALAGLTLLRPELGEQAALSAYQAAQQILNLGGARFRRRELFAALTANWPGSPLPRVRAMLG
ncbi:hypothetical protein Drose_35905 [Dactylosporangium roseum]|uniref:Transcriptional regulator n=1 Tax=Dactylosporangium roseum TaxID=47989 RepID=A0ABY5Z3H3_9ACTN|nr:hypothetical protein [Dactylosporangium roseum]UWZ36362.1 hypothetical protein Drose_35905 [Dactylosporangium roseum]